MGVVPRCCHGLPQGPPLPANRSHRHPPSPSPPRRTCRRAGRATISAYAHSLRCSGHTNRQASCHIRHRCTTTLCHMPWNEAQRPRPREDSTDTAGEKRHTPTASRAGERKRVGDSDTHRNWISRFLARALREYSAVIALVTLSTLYWLRLLISRQFPGLESLEGTDI